MDEVKELRATITQLSALVSQQNAQIRTLTEAQNELRAAVDKLGAVHGLEYLKEFKDWVDKKKLGELKSNPR